MGLLLKDFLVVVTIVGPAGDACVEGIDFVGVAPFAESFIDFLSEILGPSFLDFLA